MTTHLADMAQHGADYIIGRMAKGWSWITLGVRQLWPGEDAE